MVDLVSPRLAVIDNILLGAIPVSVLETDPVEMAEMVSHCPVDSLVVANGAKAKRA